jgi:hypothetical protein
MIFPASMADMFRGGYVFLRTKECADCGELMHFFRTPKGRKAPFVKTPRGRMVSHFAVCHAARDRQTEVTKQIELFPAHVRKSKRK